MDWDVPETEEGLQQVLLQIDQCRSAGDLVETGNGLLALAHLVKWVRSDTNAPPFARARELALEALALFREAGHEKGKLRALIVASPFVDPSAQENLLSEAEAIASKLGDEKTMADVLSARARTLAMSDRPQAEELYRRVLGIYRRIGDVGGQARTLFGLAIGEGTAEEKLLFAREAAGLYRSLGDRKHASMCISIALMNAEEVQPLTELEGLVREGLEDAQASGNRSQEAHFYQKLALISLANGQLEEAERYRRWAKDLDDADGLTPLERWEFAVDMTKSMVAMAKTQGNKEAVKLFREELKRLKAEKPKS